MDAHIDRQIRLLTDPEHKGLYKWCLQELDEKGEVVGRDQIPWMWTQFFITSELRLNRTTKKEQATANYLTANDEEMVDIEEEYELTDDEYISGILHSGNYSYEDVAIENQTTYSMFGTSRIVKHFTLNIRPVRDDDEKGERCLFWGSVETTFENDFRTELVDDMVIITFYLSTERFYNLSRLILKKEVDLFQINMSRVDGFYSEWSPSVTTNHIKILTHSSDDQVVLGEDDHDVNLLRLGETGEFEIMVMRRCDLKLNQDLRGVNHEKVLEEEKVDLYEEEAEPDEESIYRQETKNTSEMILVQLIKNHQSLNKILFTLYIIIAVLVFLLIKYFF